MGEIVGKGCGLFAMFTAAVCQPSFSSQWIKPTSSTFGTVTVVSFRAFFYFFVFFFLSCVCVCVCVCVFLHFFIIEFFLLLLSFLLLFFSFSFSFWVCVSISPLFSFLFSLVYVLFFFFLVCVWDRERVCVFLYCLCLSFKCRRCFMVADCQVCCFKSEQGTRFSCHKPRTITAIWLFTVCCSCWSFTTKISNCCVKLVKICLQITT